MQIALAQINFHVGNFESNSEKIINSIEKAKTQQVDLIVFPELAICGYPPRDFLEFNDFIDKCFSELYKIAQHCTGIAAIIGSPSKNTDNKGKELFNSAFFIADQSIKKVVHKTLLPNYDIFDEYRYFEPNRNFDIIEYKGKRIALTICEDLWNIDNNMLYVTTPMDELKKQNPDIMINIAASPFNYEQELIRKRTLALNCQKYQIPLVYVNHVGAQTELLFDGGSLAMNSKGEIINELSYFEEDYSVITVDSINQSIGATPFEKFTKIEKIHDALVMGIKNYFDKLGFKKAILGLSGGIDSALTLVLAAKALGAENVFAVLLPSEYSSNHSIKDAEDLAKNIDCSYTTIPINKVCESFEDILKPHFKDLPFGIAEENLQARSRAVILMALSNKFGYILLNTSNKSEAAVGYGTLYGDMCGGISVLGDVYKTEVYELSNFINKDKEIIPINSIIKPPSAELRPNQKDSDSLPEYDILDEILYQYIEKRKGPEELVNMGFERPTVDRILKLVNTNEYKRHQTPPILRVSPKAFGMGRRLPIVGKYLS
ncbi:MAG: NAD+ synthase [Bacteroidota bacterium]